MSSRLRGNRKGPIRVPFSMADSLFSSAVIGTAMPVELTWPDLVTRLLCTLIAGAIIGYDRGERAKAAGITTAVFDRGGFKYHGRVAAVADGARDAGLEF